MNRRIEIVLAVFLVIALAALAVSAFTARQPPEAQYFGVILLDASPSFNRREACEDIEGLGRELLRRAPHVHLIFLASGSASTTGNEPVRLGTIVVSRSGRVLEGKAREHDRESDAVSKLRSMCAALPKHNDSPLVHSLGTAVAFLRDAPCSSPEVVCEVHFSTDGIDPSLFGPRASRVRGRRIDNTNVNVRICNLASRRAGTLAGSPLDLGAIEAAFRPTFVDPSRVAFSPACAAFRRRSEGENP